MMSPPKSLFKTTLDRNSLGGGSYDQLFAGRIPIGIVLTDIAMEVHI